MMMGESSSPVYRTFVSGCEGPRHCGCFLAVTDTHTVFIWPHEYWKDYPEGSCPSRTKTTRVVKSGH